MGGSVGLGLFGLLGQVGRRTDVGRRATGELGVDGDDELAVLALADRDALEARHEVAALVRSLCSGRRTHVAPTSRIFSIGWEVQAAMTVAPDARPLRMPAGSAKAPT